MDEEAQRVIVAHPWSGPYLHDEISTWHAGSVVLVRLAGQSRLQRDSATEQMCHPQLYLAGCGWHIQFPKLRATQLCHARLALILGRAPSDRRSHYPPRSLVLQSVPDMQLST